MGTSYDQDRQIGDIVKQDRKKTDEKIRKKANAMMKMVKNNKKTPVKKK